MKVKHWLMVFVAISMFLSRPAVAQHRHAAETANVIDGSKFPERIPDNIVYKLQFFCISLTPDKLNDPAAQTERLAFLKQTGISEKEFPKVIEIVDDFRNRYEKLSAAYNQKATTAAKRGETADPTQFDNDLAGLIAMTRLELQGALSTDSMLKFHSNTLRLKQSVKM